MLVFVGISACSISSGDTTVLDNSVILLSDQDLPDIVQERMATTEYSGHIRFIEVRKNSLCVEWNIGTQLPEYTYPHSIAIAVKSANQETSSSNNNCNRLIQVDNQQYYVVWYAVTRSSKLYDSIDCNIHNASKTVSLKDPDAWLDDFPVHQKYASFGEHWEFTLVRNTIITFREQDEYLCNILASGQAIVIADCGLSGLIKFKLQGN